MKKILVVAFGLFGTLFFVSNVQAEQVAVSVNGNGSESDNSVNFNLQSTTAVNQTNTSNISNNVSQNISTGNNQTNNNVSANTNISTGNASTNTQISNSTNLNQINVNGCNGCNLPITIENNGNGYHSSNTINTNLLNNTQINAVNNSGIFNQVGVNSNTGYNQANSNLGEVGLATGDISLYGKIRNRANVTVISVDPLGFGEVNISNSFNGSDSLNEINLSVNNNLNVDKYDFAAVDNFADLIVNTGGNYANGNVGDTIVSTGAINVNFEILNDPVNLDIISVGGPKFKRPEIPGVNVPTPTIPTPISEVIAQAAAAPGQVLAAVSEILPVTGPFNFIALLAIWVLIFMVGLLLRRVSGLSPPGYLFSLSCLRNQKYVIYSYTKLSEKTASLV